MDIKGLTRKIKNTAYKFKYAVIILMVGVGLLLLPQKSTKVETTEKMQTKANSNDKTFETWELSEILQSVEGAGKVKVLLSVATGEKTLYQTDSDSTTSGDSDTAKYETVIVTDAQRSESGLVSQVNPPTYLGAIVVCEGADSAVVRYAVTQAVSKITGLGTDSICVLKMK